MNKTARPAVAAALAAGVLAGCAPLPPMQSERSQAPYSADIRRTQAGIAHVKAADWGSLGYGYGYVQAEDNLCTLADGFVTFRGERSAWFGADARPPAGASFGQPRNLDADFFFRLLADGPAVERYRAAQPPQLRELVEGFAAGYNRYVGDLDAGRVPKAHAACRGKPWVEKITADDVYQRLIAASLAGGAALFVQPVAGARPPRSSSKPGDGAVQGAPDAAPPQTESVRTPGVGSNALAFGAPITHGNTSLLFGNPHWFWRGPDRFYQAQLTIPGQLNVAGVSLLGVPLIVLGFNEDVAWTHTVSGARRFGIFQLTLDPADPTRYQYDGRSEPMTPVKITVQTRRPDGTFEPVTRTLYRSRFGPLVDLSSMVPGLGWSAQRAFALRDANADNPRAFENFLAWNQARSLNDFISIEKRLAAMPWANTIAIGRGDARVWFADMGPIPNVPDALVDSCTTPAGRAFASRMRGVPFLDGSKSECAWRSDASAVQPGALPVAQMPGIMRGDYVGNFNDGYWLTNANSPTTGYPRITGPTATQQSLRTRYGHLLAAQLQRAPGGVTRDALKTAVLESGSMSERIFRKPLLDSACNFGDSQSGLREACDVLRAWDGTANTGSRGANLWDEFWTRVTRIAPERLFATGFDPAAPLATPRGFNTANPAVVQDLRQALGGAALALRLNGFALNSRRGDILYTERNGERVPLYGGCDEPGYFTIVCARRPLDAKGYPMDVNGHGDSYVQVVSFGPQGVEADTMLAHSESDDPASPHSGDATRLFASKTWQRFPFTDAAIDADPALVRTTVTGERREEPVTRAVGPKRPLDEGTSGETRVEPDAKRVYH
ncbi:Acyl-homoserine lactone acylase PvdQ, quorum-quenching [Caballeronia glathei]|uniref:Acylase n=1 Tax=Caballeronia glathei TaxID=60547 RepID=A0A069PSH8_9BURK|nr:penicillin acylase family protein [Caballeronia glathei]KDR40241.1 acylase [Caballeronia glathei]CDY79814.1 Acyl-homoserine lactone acylase PvdQ, quorum-quenching [Caballeronia glathei]